MSSSVRYSTVASRLLRRLAALAVLLFALLPAAGMTSPAALASPAVATVVRPDPLLAEVPVGGTVTINLYVQDVVGLYGADIRLSFDTAILQVVDAVPGSAGVQITPLSTFLKPDFVVRRKACNGVDPNDNDCTGPGLVWYAATQVAPSEAVSGSGPLAAVTFRRIKAGDTKLQVIHNELAMRTGDPIPSEIQDGLLTTATVTQSRLFLPIVRR